MKHYTLTEIEALPTIEQGHTDDLKIQTSTMRVWLSRMTIEDGQLYNNQVTIEKLSETAGSPKKETTTGKQWLTFEQYEAK